MGSTEVSLTLDEIDTILRWLYDTESPKHLKIKFRKAGLRAGAQNYGPPNTW